MATITMEVTNRTKVAGENSSGCQYTGAVGLQRDDTGW